MAENDIDTKFCVNCKREIAASNFIMHEVHCKRNIVLCPHCDEPYPRIELDAHIDDEHTDVQCTKCRKVMEKNMVENHEENECPQRIVQCEYCEIDIAYADLKDHLGYCGTRTEQCPTCDRYIMVKDQRIHEDSNCNYPAQKTQNNANSDGHFNSFVFDELSRVMETDVTNIRRNDVSFPPERNYRITHQHGSRTGTSNNSNRVIINDTPSRRIKNTNQKNDVTTARKREMRNYNFETNGSDRSLDADNLPGGILPMVPCEICSKTFPIDFISQHERECLDNLAEQNQRVPSPVLSSQTEGTVLPCEFCGTLLPPDDLVIHESGCGLNNLHRASASSETRNEPAVMDNLAYMAAETWLSQPIAADFTTADDIMLPCEFCDCLFPEDFLIQHQAVCDANNTKTPRVTTPAASGMSAAASSRITNSNTLGARPKKMNTERPYRQQSLPAMMDDSDSAMTHTVITNPVSPSNKSISNVSKRNNKGTNLTNSRNISQNNTTGAGRQRSTAFKRQNSDSASAGDQNSASELRSRRDNTATSSQRRDGFMRNPISGPVSSSKAVNRETKSFGEQLDRPFPRSSNSSQITSSNRRNSQPEDFLAVGGYEASFATNPTGQRPNKTRTVPITHVGSDINDVTQTNSRSNGGTRSPQARVKKTNNSRLPRH
ncbi:uncharacterized protein LOC141899217 [Tubulanus polymorphus]|uniref:uncharacterized protein LOC141899217 n=1 Tax=Tubulanus polymorphus TaxID=672921 RepID=UPI003DA4488F